MDNTTSHRLSNSALPQDENKEGKADSIKSKPETRQLKENTIGTELTSQTRLNLTHDFKLISTVDKKRSSNSKTNPVLDSTFTTHKLDKTNRLIRTQLSAATQLNRVKTDSGNLI